MTSTSSSTGAGEPPTAPPGPAQEFEAIQRVGSHVQEDRNEKHMQHSRAASLSTATTSTQEENNSNDTNDTEEIKNASTLERHPSALEKVMTNKSSIVPRRQRRGILGSLSIVPEIENPYEYKRPVKNWITIVVAAGGAAAPMASSIVFPALGQIADQLHSTPTLTNLSVALYMLAMAIFPLWWSSFAERGGRRTTYIVSFTLYVVSNVCAALSVNIGMLIAFRICSGATAASVQAVGAGTISDIWEVRERGRAMGFFYLGPLCGPLFSPIIGGAVTSKWGWRSTQWFLAIFGACELLFIIFGLPETLRKKPKEVLVVEKPETEKTENGATMTRTLTRVSTTTRQKTRSCMLVTKSVLWDPLKALKFLRFPPVLLTVSWASLTFGSLYILNVSLQNTYAKPPYNFSTLIVGLTYIPNSLGYIISSVVGGRWNDTIMRRAAMKRRARLQSNPETRMDPEPPLEYRPEDRMGVNAWLAGILYPLGLLWYGWAIQEGVFWFVPMIATFIFGLGSMMVFSMATTMLTEFVPGRSSSAVAVNNFVRNIFSCVGGVIAEPIIDAIGNGWLMTILCILGLLSLCVPWLMQRHGPRWRARAHEYKIM